MASIVSFIRIMLPRQWRFVTSCGLNSSGRTSSSRLNRALSIVFILLIVAAIGATIYIVAISEGGEKYTEFYILGSAGKAENYPTEIVLGEEARVIIGIVNREREDTSYLVEVMIDKVTSVKIGPIMLADEEEWEKEVSFIPTRIGEDQKVEFALHRGEQVNPYLTLHLWLNVKAP